MTATRLERFAAKVGQVRATIVNVSDEAAARALVATAVPLETAATGDAEYAAVAARAAFAVAETGSVGLVVTAAERAACFLATHLCVLVRESEIVPGLEAALQRIAAEARVHRTVTLMTGPSRTADIERTLTIGVHGPRELTIVVIAGS